MTYFKKENIGKTTAIISLIIGTILIALFYFTYSPEILFAGYIYVILIIIFNIAVFIAGLVEAFNNKILRKKLLKNNGLILLNIPIALAYFWLAIFLLNTIKLTLINPTNTELTNLKLTGCETEIIDNMKPGERRTIWISINNDCNINLEFENSEQVKNEIVLGYATSMGGQQIEHKIGEGNQEI